MFMLKACPTCGGDLRWDDADQEWVCSQGGHRFSNAQIGPIIDKAKPLIKEAPVPLLDMETLRKIYTTETVRLIPIPLRPIPAYKLPMHRYYLTNRESIIAEAIAYGEKAATVRWGIMGGVWTQLKYRRGLPVGQQGGLKFRSALPAPKETK